MSADSGSYVKPLRSLDLFCGAAGAAIGLWPTAPRCALCGLRIRIDLYGGSTCWIHLSKRANADHYAER
jgi:hypothetical protein